MGWIALNGQRSAMRKPRARKDGKEISLKRYDALQSMDNLEEMIFRMMLNGISTRNYDRTLQKFEDDLGLSKSSVSREFVKKSREALNILNSRKFPDATFWAIFLDGIEFAGTVAIVALGVDLQGNKHILGISEGSTENSEVCTGLLSNIMERDIRFTDKIIAVLDGSKALKKAVISVFGKRVEIQRCLLHKRRNVEGKLEKKFHGELKSRITQAYELNDYLDARKSFSNIVKWLDGISHGAARSLEEGLEDLLTLHRIKMPPELRKSFYTTNLIESSFSNPRNHANRVKRWRKNTDQVMRWAGSLLIYQEERFNKVRGYRNIEIFLSEFLSHGENIVAENIAV